MTTDSTWPPSTIFMNSLYASGGGACWPCRNMVASMMIITRMTTHSAMFRYWLFKSVDPRTRDEKPWFSRSLADDFAAGAGAARQRAEPEPRAIAAEFESTGQLDAPARRATAQEQRDPLEVNALDVSCPARAHERLAREPPRQGLGQRAPVLRVDPQPGPLGGEARLGLPVHPRADPLAIPALCFGKIGDRPEQSRVELARERGQRGAQPVARVIGRGV